MGNVYSVCASSDEWHIDSGTCEGKATSIVTHNYLLFPKTDKRDTYYTISPLHASVLNTLNVGQ